MTWKIKLNSKLTQTKLKEILYYSKQTGIFTWVSTKSFKKIVGNVAGTQGKNLYISISINKKRYLAHRLAWFYVTGKWPKKDIDHKDRNPSNNIWINLREATARNNGGNHGKHKSNTTGFKGVSRRKGKNKKPYQSQIRVNYKQIHLGYYDTPEEAHQAYVKAAKQYFGEFACAA